MQPFRRKQSINCNLTQHNKREKKRFDTSVCSQLLNDMQYAFAEWADGIKKAS